MRSEGLLASLHGNSVTSVSLLPRWSDRIARKADRVNLHTVSSSEALVQADGTGAILPNGANELTEEQRCR